MKYIKIIPIVIFLLATLLSACQKYEIEPYKTKMKYYITGIDTVTLFYNNKDELIELSNKDKINKYFYKNTEIIEKITENYEGIETVYKNRLIPNNDGLIIKKITNNNKDTIYYTEVSEFITS